MVYRQVRRRSKAGKPYQAYYIAYLGASTSGTDFILVEPPVHIARKVARSKVSAEQPGTPSHPRSTMPTRRLSSFPFAQLRPAPPIEETAPTGAARIVPQPRFATAIDCCDLPRFTATRRDEPQRH